MSVMMSSKVPRKRSRGFTLLEVIVALAITGFVLGSLFSLVGGSKQLTWRSQDSLIRATELRAVTNFALLQDEFRNVDPILDIDRYSTISGEELEAPERKTQPTVYALQRYEIFNEETEQTVEGTRWIRLDLPR
jgi:prepilin-type N-terminal cleavage/methylation domain-containing protein